jgi:tetratricopeptide (TPR) repeat protein
MEGTPSYIPFVEMIESVSRLVEPTLLREILGESAPEVAKLMPELRRKFADIPEPPTLPPEQERRYMFNGVLDFITRAAQAQQLLLVFEDLHWADESTMLLLQHIAPQLNDMPVLLIGTYRDTELAASLSLARILEGLLRQRLAHDMILKRLSEAEVADMLGKRSGQKPPSRLLEVIYQETDGNPFFVEEVFKHLTEEEKLFDSGGKWRTDLSLDEADVPRGVRLVVGHRLERVSKQCQQTLTAAAAIGRAVSFELLEESVKLDEDVLLDAIDEAERAQVIRSTTRAGDVQFIFTHELIRQTLLSDLSALRRQRLHLQVAEAIERVYASGLDDHAAELAYHLYRAGGAADFPKAIRYLTLAGDQALNAAAFEDALRLYNNAHSSQSSDNEQAQAEILYRRGLSLRSLARREEALADWRETLAIYERLDDIEAVGQICTELSTYLFSIAQFEEAYEVAVRGLAALEDRVNPDRCRLLATLGFLVSNVREAGFDAAHDLFAQALQMAEKLKNERIVGPILGQKAFLHHAYWQGSEAADVGLRAAQLSQSIDPYNASYPFAYGGQCGMFWIGQLDEAARIGADAEALAARAGNEHARWFAGHYDSFREVAVTGDLVRFENRRSALLEMELALESGWITLSYAYLGRAKFWRGNWEEAREALRKSAEADVRGHTAGISDSLLFLLAAYLKDKEAALAILQKRQDILPRAGQPNMTASWIMLDAAIEGLAVLEEWHEAAELYPLALAAIATKNVMRAGFYGLVQTTAGIAATAARQWDQAEEHFDTALKQAHEIPYIIEQPEVRRWYALMLIERDGPDDRKKARTLLNEAIQMYNEIGMPKHLEMAEELMRRM